MSYPSEVKLIFKKYILLLGLYEWFFVPLKAIFNILYVGIISPLWVLIVKHRPLGRTYPANCPSSFNMYLGLRSFQVLRFTFII